MDMNKHIHVFVITIKLGTKTCGVNFQTGYDFEHNPRKVTSVNINSRDSQSDECPTSLLLTRKGDVSFGYEARDIFTDSPRGVFFGNFGESLYLSEDFDERTVITDSTGKEHNALDMFAKYINALYEFIVNELTNKPHQELRPSDIKWVLTVPSVRADRSVNFFQKGWRKAKMTDDVVTVVTYPNAALNYCLYLPPEQCNNVPLHQFKKGQRLLVVGLEEELDSFNVYEKIDDQRFKQVVHFLSGSSTRQLILREFDSFFEDLIGSWIWKTFKILHEELWQRVCQKVDFLMEKNVEPDTKITFSSMFTMLKYICFEHTNANLKEIIQSSEYGKQVTIVSDKIRVDSNLIKSLFDRGIGKVIHNIGEVLERSDDKAVNTMIFVGNIANSGLFLQEVQTKYPEKQIIIPNAAIKAAVKGAVLFGHKPIVISSIFCGAQCLVPR